MGVLHLRGFQSGRYLAAGGEHTFPAACGWGAPEEPPTPAHDVTCRSCRRTIAWRDQHRVATRLHREIRRTLLRTDFDQGRNVERVLLLVAGGSLLKPADEHVVTMDRWLSGDIDLDALLEVLAPVHPGWDDVRRAGEVVDG